MHIDWMSTSIAYVYTYTYIYHEYVHRHVQVNVTQQYRTFLALHPPAERKLPPTAYRCGDRQRASSTSPKYGDDNDTSRETYRPVHISVIFP